MLSKLQPTSIRLFREKGKNQRQKRRQRKKLKVMSLPHWPTPAGQEQWDVPCFHLDTFIMTKNNSSERKKKDVAHKGRQKGRGD